MGILRDEDLEYIKERFRSELVSKIPIVLFTSSNCEYCDSVQQLLEDISSVSNNKIDLVIRELQDIHQKILGVSRGPVILIGKHAEIRYTGAPFGEEAWGFLEAIVLTSNRRHKLGSYEKDLSSLDRRVKIETIVTPTCPWCPHAAILAHKIAVASHGKVISDVVEAYEFPEIANKFNVTGVPTIVLSVDGNYNGKVFSVGVPRPKALINAILKLGIKE